MSGRCMAGGKGGDMAFRTIPGLVFAIILIFLLECVTVPLAAEPEGRTAAVDKARASLSIAVPTARTTTTPLILAHYMPWFQAPPVSSNFGWHWHMGSTDPYEKDGNGLRRIASHYYPLTGPYDSTDPALLEYQILLMKMSGIDGVIVDWYGVSGAFDYPLLHAATQALFAAVKAAGLKFAICYEDQAIGNRVKSGSVTVSEAADALSADLTWAAANWFSDDVYLSLDGRPVLLDFGPAYFKDPRMWAAVRGRMSRRPILVTLDGSGGRASDAAFSWPPMGLSIKGVLTPDALVTYLNNFYAGNRARPWLVSTAFPGFHDYYSQAKVRPSYGYLDDYIGATFKLTLDVSLTSQANVVQIATWNDYGEGTIIEPTLQNGYRDLETLQAFRHRLDPAFPFTREDLRVPLQIWARRIAGSAADAQLGALAAAIISKDAATYRSFAESLGISSASAQMSPTAVEREK